MLDLSGLPLSALAGIFLAAATVVWLAGARLSGYAEAISERTGLGTVFLGALFLGGITSLPELATSVTASIAGDADLAVNNLFGGVAMQVAILAVADATTRSGPLSSTAREPVILLQGVLLIFVLALAAGGMVVGEPAAWPVGPWAIAVFAAAVFAFRLFRRYEGHAAWRPVTQEGRLEQLQGPGSPDRVEEDSAPQPQHTGDRRRTLRTLILLAALAGLAILGAGVVLTRTAERIAASTGLGSSFVGVALLAASTSLPEVSTTIAAARLGRFDMAFSNVFGANLLDVGLIAIADLAYGGPPVLGEVGTFAIFAAILAIGVTAVFLGGLIQRRVRTFAGVGADSVAVLALYLGGLYALFTLR